MAILVNAHQLRKSFAARPLFDGISFSIESGEKIGLIGPNGAGKSTLMRILAGQSSEDTGNLSLQRGLKVGFLEQVPEFTQEATIWSAILEGARDPDDWEVTSLAHEILSKLSLSSGDITPETSVRQLSGGWRKRVALGRELIRQPDLLLLDEPTNHLDVESILWLEELISNSSFATLTITHDRLFLQRISNRILELDRRNPGGLLSVSGDYATFLETKEAMMSAQEKQETRMRNTLRRETEWLRRGAKARTTKQQARIQRAGDLKESVEELTYRNQNQKVRIDFQAAEKNPKKLIEAKGISKSYGNKLIVPQLDLQVIAGSRIGLLGTNGCGKSTLIRMLLGTEEPDTGEILRSEHLQIAYFEQNRETLDPQKTVRKTICPVGDFVDFRGGRTHVKSYLDRFLFTQGQMDMAVGKLSGGEQSRLLLAMLMLKEANLLVLDEPTNDLDMPTLEILEDVLQEFGGAVLLVTHDRYFLDHVARQILAFGVDEKGKKRIIPYSGYSQWEAQKDIPIAAIKEPVAEPALPKGSDPASSSKKKRLGFKEQRELEGMEEKIRVAEARLAALTVESNRPETVSNSSRLTEITREMGELEGEIERLFARWSELT